MLDVMFDADMRILPTPIRRRNRLPGLHSRTSGRISVYWLRVFLFLAREEQREGAGFEEMQC
jgi:hypothetical protein